MVGMPGSSGKTIVNKKAPKPGTQIDEGLTEEEMEVHIRSMLKQAGFSNVTEFIILTMQDMNDVKAFATGNVRQSVHPALLRWGKSCFAKVSDLRDVAPDRNEGTAQMYRSNDVFDEDTSHASISRPDQAAGGTKGGRVTKSRALKRGRKVPKPLASEEEHGLAVQQMVASIETAEAELLPQQNQMCSMRIHDREKVAVYLTGRMDILQQQVLKSLAKIWIKIICPKKQAKFPYQNKSRKEDTGLDPEVPGWWPPIGVCPFTEPDHISKHQRIALCLHLLRLRPTPQRLNEWNNDTAAEPHPTHVNMGWTAFLREHTPMTIFNGITPEPEEKMKRRGKVLDDLYEVASREEEYEKDGHGGDEMIQWCDDVTVPSSAVNKRSRTSSVATNKGEDFDYRASPGDVMSKRMRQDSHQAPSRSNVVRNAEPTAASINDNSRPSSVRSMARRACAGFLIDEPGSFSPATARPRATIEQARARAVARLPRYCEAVPGGSQPAQQQFTSPLRYSQALAYQPRWMQGSVDSYQSSSVESSFDSSNFGGEEQNPQYSMTEVHSTFPGRREYNFGPFMSTPNTVQVNHVTGIPQPRFRPVAENHIFPSADMMYMSGPENPTIAAGPMHVNSYGAGGFGAGQPAEQNTMPAEYADSNNTNESSPVQNYGQTGGHANMQMVTDGRFGHPGYDMRASEPPTVDANGRAISFSHRPSTPQDQEFPYSHPEQKPETEFQSAALPGAVVRGFTGHASGVGGGAWI